MQIQKDLAGNVKKPDADEPWTGICCKACWNGRAKWCECKCGGAHHGEGLGDGKGEKQKIVLTKKMKTHD
jgi:hypothetical protein